MLVSLPLGALSVWSAARVQEAFDASTTPPWSEAYVGTMAASVFMVPVAVGGDCEPVAVYANAGIPAMMSGMPA